MNGTAATTPAARASSTSSAASALLVASGFSQMTCLPALSAIRTNGACRWFGVQMCTTSTSGEVTSSSADAAELVERARAAGVVAAVPFIYRYYPTVREARARVASGASGAIHLIHGSYLQDWLSTAKDQNWRVDPTLG